MHLCIGAARRDDRKIIVELKIGRLEEDPVSSIAAAILL
jgi:hypothetical protein